MPKFTLHADGQRAWLLREVSTGITVGGVVYAHAADGNHYRAWVLRDGVRHTIDPPVPQLRMAARSVAEATEHVGSSTDDAVSAP